MIATTYNNIKELIQDKYHESNPKNCDFETMTGIKPRVVCYQKPEKIETGYLLRDIAVGFSKNKLNRFLIPTYAIISFFLQINNRPPAKAN